MTSASTVINFVKISLPLPSPFTNVNLASEGSLRRQPIFLCVCVWGGGGGDHPGAIVRGATGGQLSIKIFISNLSKWEGERRE